MLLKERDALLGDQCEYTMGIRPITVKIKVAEERIELPSGIVANPGEFYLQLHFGFGKKEIADGVTLKLSTYRDHLSRVSEWIRYFDWNPAFIYGVTNEHLARVSERYGFAAERGEINSKRYIQRLTKSSQDAGVVRRKGIGQVMLIYQSGEDFMNKFSGGEKQEPVFDYMKVG